MKRRLEGFVVGRQSVQRQRGWKIGRRTRHGRTDYFAPEAEIAEGFEVAPSAEVTFSATTREGRLYALNVQPKSATMEDSMRKLIVGVIAALVLAIVALVGVYKPHHQEPIRSWIVEFRAERALDAIRELSIDELVDDEIVRAAVRDNRWGDLRGASWAAREAVFAEHQCHVFDLGGYENSIEDEDMCWWARYYEGSDDPWVFEKKGIPTAITDHYFPAMRRALYELGRSYLKVPANLRALYRAKKSVVVDEFRRLSAEARQAQLASLVTAISAFEQFRDDPQTRVLHGHTLRLEAALFVDKTDSLVPYRTWKFAAGLLGQKVSDPRAYSFAARRYAEGGDELVEAYVEIMKDLASTLGV